MFMPAMHHAPPFPRQVVSPIFEWTRSPHRPIAPFTCRSFELAMKLLESFFGLVAEVESVLITDRLSNRNTHSPARWGGPHGCGSRDMLCLGMYDRMHKLTEDS